TVADADAAAAQIRAAADQAARQTELAARQQAQGMLANASAAQAQAQAGAARIIEQARAEADAIAADARRTVEEAGRLEATVRALRNVIEGYGDAYVVPTSGLLDELAEHFGHTEAGEKLKA